MEKTLLAGLPAPAIEYISTLENRLAKLQDQVERLTELLIQAQKEHFGPSSEKARYVLADGYEQMALFNEAEAFAEGSGPEPVIIAGHARKPKRTREELAKDLPVVENVIDIPEDRRRCDICEGSLHPIGRELVRRELSVIPEQVYVTETYRVNYGCGECLSETGEANIMKPEVPAPVVKRGLASPSSAAHVMYQKFVNAMPLYRQSRHWENFGVKISRGTLANWVIHASLDWLLPLWLALKSLLLESPVILADETVVQVLDEPGKTPQSESRMWVYCTGDVKRPPPIVLFEYQPGRSGAHPEEFLKVPHEFFLHTDGYSGYNGVDNAVHCGCWAHLRRKFEEAMPKNAPAGNAARTGFEYCQKLFMLERGFEGMDPGGRLEKRIGKSRPMLDEFHGWVETLNPLAGSKLAKAVTYALNQRGPLSAFLLDGRIEISTNRIENKIRPFAVGRRNWLFSETVDGARASATAYSIIQTAVANGLNPYQYLLHLFTHLPTVLGRDPEADLSSFLPWGEEVRATCKYSQGNKGQLAFLG